MFLLKIVLLLWLTIKLISYKSIENKISDKKSYEEKISIIEEHIDILLQLEKSKEFQVDALKKDVDT